MAANFIKRSLSLLLSRQTNIISAAFIIMLTIVLSQVLGVIRQRLLGGIFGVTDTLGIYSYASLLPDTVFQLTIAAALSSAFIPVFSEYLTAGKEKEGHQMASNLLILGMGVFFSISLVLSIFAPFFLQIFNQGGQFTPDQIMLMANLMRIIVFGQFIFIVGTFLTALLQSYNHFFIPGIAAALYNLGIIIGIVLFSESLGIYSAPIGVIIGALIFVLIQIPLAKRIGFSFRPSFSNIYTDGIRKVVKIMLPRVITIVILQLGTISIASLISFLVNPGRAVVIYDFAKTLAFAPVVLFGQSIAQAAFPVLSREKERLEDFKVTFMTTFSQMLYIILPVSVLCIVLRVPMVRLIYGAEKFDWEATVLVGGTLAFLSISMFAQALIALVLRAFYALHNSKTPLFISAITTVIMIVLSYLFILLYKSGLRQIDIPYSVLNVIKGRFIFNIGIEGIAFSFSIATILHFLILMIILNKKVGGFKLRSFMSPIAKIFIASFFTGIALYVPIKLLDRLVFDTTRTINLIILTGISSFVGLSLYLFLTWAFNVKEAIMFVLLFRRIGNWREILKKSNEVIERTQVNP